MKDRQRTTSWGQVGIWLAATVLVVASWACGGGRGEAPGRSAPSGAVAVDIVVAHFENATVEPTLSLAPEAAFRGGLERHGAVLPEARLQELAAGLDLEPGAPVDRPAALQVARQIGASRVVAPRLAPVTSGYSVDATILDAATGEVLFEHSELTIDKRGLMAAVDKLTRAVSAELEP